MLIRITRLANTMGLVVWLMSLSAPTHAQTIQPGLWEITSKMPTGAMDKMPPEQRKAMEQAMSPEAQKAMQAQMQKQMANMPPEQRKAMEQAMAMRSNMSMGSDGNIALKMCMTQEMIDRRHWMSRVDGKCTHTVSPLVGNTQKFSFTCTEPVSSGEGIVTFQSSTKHTTAMKISSVRNGKTETMSMEGSSQFLSADCGTVKPMVTPGQK